MRITYGFDALGEITRPVATIGSFDGVHQGHRSLLHRLDELAAACGGERVVITFSPHPRHVLDKKSDLKLLNTLPEKALLLEQCGIDHLIVVNFTPEFSHLSFSDFVQQDLVNRLHIHTLLVGFNHHLGHNKAGNFEALQGLSNTCGFALELMPQQLVEGEKVSSTIVRNLLLDGNIAQANLDLGNPYLIVGRVNGIGRMSIEAEKLLPPAGAYLVTVSRLAHSRHASPIKEATLYISAQREVSLSADSYTNAVVCVKF